MLLVPQTRRLSGSQSACNITFPGSRVNGFYFELNQPENSVRKSHRTIPTLRNECHSCGMICEMNFPPSQMFNEIYKTAAWLVHVTSKLLAQLEEIPFHGSVILNLYAKTRRRLHVIKCTFHTYRSFKF